MSNLSGTTDLNTEAVYLVVTIIKGAIANITMGQSPKSKYYNQDGIGLPFLQGVANFGFRFPNHQTFCTVKSRIGETGDIHFSVRAPVGRINISPGKIILGCGLSAILSNCEQQNFFLYNLKNLFFIEDMMGGGAIYASISKKDIHGVELFQLIRVLVDMFQDHVNSIDRQIETLTMAIECLTKARYILLPRLKNRFIVI